MDLPLPNEQNQPVATTEPPGPARLETFSDGVFAIILTITVLEMKVPSGSNPAVFKPLLPVFLTYALSFEVVGAYWNNHHHLLHVTKKVTGKIMWANLHLLFWLSLVPFVTGWLGENHGGSWPTALYAGILLLSAIAYQILQRAIVASQGKDSRLASALGEDYKGWLSLTLYALAVGAAFWLPWVSDILFVLVALMWFIPDRRIVRTGEAASGLRPAEKDTNNYK